MGGMIVAEPALVVDDQEVELIRLIAEGLVLDVIARRLSVSERTLRRRIRALCDRVGVETPVQLAVLAARHGVI